MTAAIGETGVMTGTPKVTVARSTRQGAAVERVLGEADTFLSAQDIYVALRGSGESVGLATVYRHLQRMADAGAVDAVQGGDDELVYRVCGSVRHHHHLVCRRCRRSTELESAEVERWAARQAEQRGYTDVEHTVELFGTCESCRAGAEAAR